MKGFDYKSNELFCEGVPVRSIAEQIGTPFYLYSYNTLYNNYIKLEQALGNYPHLICYSVKANSNISILKIFSKLGAGFDIVSKGELYRVLIAEGNPKNVVFSGVGKREEEIKYAIENEILMFNVESEQELYKINDIAKEYRVKAPVAFRINPDIDPATHPYISTGLKENKFGIPISKALELYLAAKNLENIDILGIDFHLGSQIINIEPFIEAVEKVKVLVEKLELKGINIKYIDIGGGLGIDYKNQKVPSFEDYVKSVLSALNGLNCKLILEPGRAIVGKAGALISKVLYLKNNYNKNFVIIDAAMNDLLRPSLYNAYHKILPISLNTNSSIQTDIVGPICESSDFFAKNLTIPNLAPNDLLAILDTGAYGFSMSSNYNSRLKVPEVIVKEDKFFVIRKRDSLNDLIQNEVIVDI